MVTSWRSMTVKKIIVGEKLDELVIFKLSLQSNESVLKGYSKFALCKLNDVEVIGKVIKVIEKFA